MVHATLERAHSICLANGMGTNPIYPVRIELLKARMWFW